MAKKIKINCEKRTISWDEGELNRQITYSSNDLQGAIATICVLMKGKDSVEYDGLKERVENYVF